MTSPDTAAMALAARRSPLAPTQLDPVRKVLAFLERLIQLPETDTGVRVLAAIRTQK